MKTCTDCGVTKTLDEFAIRKDRSNGEGRSAYCKKCIARRSKEWRKANPDKLRDANRNWYQNNKEYDDEKHRERRQQHPERQAELRRQQYLKHKETHLKLGRAWAQRNPSKIRAKEIRRNAREHNAKGNASAEDIANRVELFGGKCWICGTEYQEIDHVIPLSKGGTNYPANLRPICKSCNSRKRDRDWKQFLKRLFSW